MKLSLLTTAIASVLIAALPASAITLDINKQVIFEPFAEYNVFNGYAGGDMLENGFRLSGQFDFKAKSHTAVSMPEPGYSMVLSRDDGRAFFLNSVSFATPTFTCASSAPGTRDCLQFASVRSSAGETIVSTHDYAYGAGELDNDGQRNSAKPSFGSEVNGTNGVTQIVFSSVDVLSIPGVALGGSEVFTYGGKDYYYEWEYDLFAIMQMDVSLAPVGPVTPVPVPGAGGLAALAFGGLLFARRRKAA